jgi:hypothetical protein
VTSAYRYASRSSPKNSAQRDVLRGFALSRSGVTGLIAKLGCLLFSCGRMAAGLQHQDAAGCQQDHGNDSHERDCL